MNKYGYSRRDFLKQMGYVTAGGALVACAGPAAPSGGPGQAQEAAAGAEIAAGVPRNETIILENPTGRVVAPEDFNRWRPGVQTPCNVFH